MGKKTIHLISFVLVLATAGLVSAATIQWDNGGTSPLWSVPENWEPDGVPAAADTVQFYIPDANCLIDASVAAECTTLYVGTGQVKPCYLDMTGGTLTLSGNLRVGEARDSNGVFILSDGVVDSTAGRLWVGMNGNGTFIMRGGILNIYDKVEVGKNAPGNGIIYMEGGVMNLTGNSTDLEIGSYGKGLLQMTGGVINLQDNIKLAQGNATTLTGVGRLNLYGGTLNAGNLRNPADGIYGTPRMDITEGMLTLPGDYRAMVNDYISRGWIVAYDSNGIVDVTYTTEPNRTTVTGRRLAPELAWGPTPRHRATAERPVTLTWRPGAYVVSHDVYFGTDFNDVNEASRDDPRDVLVSRGQTGTTRDAGPLALGQVCYWRVDEVNDANAASPWKGVVWQFTVADYIVVDDFESYNAVPDTEEDSRRVYLTWADGYADPAANGGVIGYAQGDPMETTTVHGGKQSVPVTYDNGGAPYSEVSVSPADLSVGTDWSQDGVTTLSLWFYGALLNGADQMYVKLNGVKVLYGGPATDLQRLAWQQWNIPLADFATDLSNVTELTIGFTKSGVFGGLGTVLFDDIRLLVTPPQP
jgi:hypothetical protein